MPTFFLIIFFPNFFFLRFLIFCCLDSSFGEQFFSSLAGWNVGVIASQKSSWQSSSAAKGLLHVFRQLKCGCHGGKGGELDSCPGEGVQGMG